MKDFKYIQCLWFSLLNKCFFLRVAFRLWAVVPARSCSCLHVAAQRKQEPLGAGGRCWRHSEPVCWKMDCEYGFLANWYSAL